MKQRRGSKPNDKEKSRSGRERRGCEKKDNHRSDTRGKAKSGAEQGTAKAPHGENVRERETSGVNGLAAPASGRFIVEVRSS